MSTASGLRRVLRLLARPVYRSGGDRRIVIQPFRGYGSPKEIFCMGRVMRQPRAKSSGGNRGMARDLLDVLRRILRRGVGEAVLVARFGESRQKTTADGRGFFRFEMKLEQPPQGREPWHQVDLTLVEPAAEVVSARAPVFVATPSARFVVISDIDDTVMFTGVANKLMMFWRLFMRSGESRVAFPGVAAFYRALHDGDPGSGRNPMLYVSRGPWTVYEMLDEFFAHHRIPEGPVLFLRDWGVSPRRPLGYSGRGHKERLIREMLEVYAHLPFVLVGDSGQRDPEIYADMVHAHPGRVLAVYIRDVSHAERREDIQRLAREVEASGSTLVLSADSFAMAEHAADMGLISREALAGVLEERNEERRAEGD